MKIKQTTFIGIAIFAALASWYLCNKNNSSKTINDNKILTVGIAAGYAPWISINQQGDYEGFDIDVIKQTAANMNRTLILKDLGSMSSLLIALEQGSIDAIIWGMSITQERLQKFAMIHYQGEKLTSYPLLFWQQIPAGIQGFEDMAGMTICVEPSSAQHSVITKYPNIIQLPTESIDLGLLNIQYGKAAGVFVEPAIAKKFTAKFPEIQTLDITLNADDQVDGVGIMIKKENVELIKTIEDAIKQLKENGFIAQAQNRWEL
jgi:ABC-type amino acid transport substrate-binding protein